MTEENHETAEEIGDVILAAFKENAIVESEPWAIERVERVLKRLHEARKLKNKFRVVIPWIQEPTAFTAPGRYIFVSRSLFQLCDSDDMFAMLVGHEISHHDLGHIKVFPDWFKYLTNLDMQVLTLTLYRVVEMRIYQVEQECDADRNGLELCLKAGYDGEKCVEFFNKLEKLALDMGAVESAYGAGNGEESNSMSAKFRQWLNEMKRGYLPIRERRNLLLEYLQQSKREV